MVSRGDRQGDGLHAGELDASRYGSRLRRSPDHRRKQPFCSSIRKPCEPVRPRKPPSARRPKPFVHRQEYRRSYASSSPVRSRRLPLVSQAPHSACPKSVAPSPNAGPRRRTGAPNLPICDGRFRECVVLCLATTPTFLAHRAETRVQIADGRRFALVRRACLVMLTLWLCDACQRNDGAATLAFLGRSYPRTRRSQGQSRHTKRPP